MATFCTLLSPGISNEILIIPQEFQKHILNELLELALLKIKYFSHCAWNIRVHQIGTNIYLKEGWREFLEDHSIGDGELLIVRYDGRMQFSIQIFDKNHIERIDFPDTEIQDENLAFANDSASVGNIPSCQSSEFKEINKGEAAAFTNSEFPSFTVTIPDYCYGLVNESSSRLQ
uniref:B3 domain-containing protein Os03g0212300-like isoform X2 n=1 Tax=Fragaria vesca subsp. vesca TaxID=101020 RepID=UPI0005CA2C7F|nr:PREDICTED: B3 domain-containing protein Os03g0212300-like isoform X2 [Fragaria vesca subsp. vesca]